MVGSSLDGLTLIESGNGFVSLNCSPDLLTEFTALVMC